MVDLNPVRGHEQSGNRPGLVLSVDLFNHGPAGLVVLLPLTTSVRNIPFHVELNPPEGGVSMRSFIKCEDIRAVATERLSRRLGSVSPATMRLAEDRISILLDL